MNKVLIIMLSLVSFNAFCYGTPIVLTDDPVIQREVEMEIGRREQTRQVERQRAESESINRRHYVNY